MRSFEKHDDLFLKLEEETVASYEMQSPTFSLVFGEPACVEVCVLTLVSPGPCVGAFASQRTVLGQP